LPLPHPLTNLTNREISISDIPIFCKFTNWNKWASPQKTAEITQEEVATRIANSPVCEYGSIYANYRA